VQKRYFSLTLKQKKQLKNKLFYKANDSKIKSTDNDNNNIFDICCRMSAIAVGNVRETVKDMVLAEYRVPKGVSIHSSLQIQKLRVPDVFLASLDPSRLKIKLSNNQLPNHLTSWSRILFRKLIFARTIKEFPEIEGSLSCPDELATGSYLKPDKHTPLSQTLFSWDHFNIILPSQPRSSE
jgi:hypothetical protein